MDVLLLSRIQFAWAIAFHILLPAFTVGAALMLVTTYKTAFGSGSRSFTYQEVADSGHIPTGATKRRCQQLGPIRQRALN
jgi:hypothetical protein